MKIEDGFLDEFESMEDPRIERCKLHPMQEILFLTICGVLCGCESWEDFEVFGESKLDFLKEYLPYKNGIPSDDTLRRFYRALNPKKFQECFVGWMKRFQIQTSQGVIAIDGKTSRRTHDGSQQALHLVSAFASEARLVLAQQKVLDHSNEITAIPEILNWLEIRGSLVSIDAMGCQTDIAEKIRIQGGDYLLGLKGNQGTLLEDVREFFESELASADPVHAIHSTQEVDKGHGRLEKRKCSVCSEIEWLKERHPRWKDLAAIVRVEAERTLGAGTSRDIRYYLTSRCSGPGEMLAATRSHWSVENSLHWVLDMSFGDDYCRIRKEHAPLNMAIIKHIAVNMIRNSKAKSKRMSVRRLRKKAGWDHDLLRLLIAQNL